MNGKQEIDLSYYDYFTDILIRNFNFLINLFHNDVYPKLRIIDRVR